eukprot:15022969-Ditylum_brightwellii.AAC.1
MVSFVDDTTGQLNEFESETNDVEKLVSIMQQDAQLWSDLLSVSGGFCIPLEKLKKIKQKVQQAFATKCGFNCNMKYAVGNGPEELGRTYFFSLVH